MSRAFLLLIVAMVSLMALPPMAGAQTSASFALRAGRIITAAPGQPGVMNGGVIIVRDGKIVAVGTDIAVPSDLPLIELPDATVMPGLVAAVSNVGVTRVPDESIGAAYRASDNFDRYADYRQVLASGVTTAHLSPGATRLMSGQGGVARLGGPASSRVLSAASDLTITLDPGAYNPPPIVEELVPPSSDNAIKPASAQRPSSRIGQLLALKEAVGEALKPPAGAKFDDHGAALARAWQANLPVRVQSQRQADLAGALAFLASNQRKGYIVGGTEAAALADQIAGANVPLVYTLSAPRSSPAANLGNDPEALEPDLRSLAALGRVRLALAVAPGQSVMGLRLAAATALRAGLTRERIIEAITRVPAEILGVADRVGSLAPGLDADLLVLSGDPLETTTHVLRVYAAGRLAFRAPGTDAVVVKAGTVWLGPDQWLTDGSVLIEKGKIVAVGKHVPTPPGASVIDGGPGSFMTPGLIDAYGHLGLQGDNTTTGPDLSLARLVGVADVAELRVARAGVTTVMVGPYRAAQSGSRIAAIKTAGDRRDRRVVSETAGLVFDVTDVDPASVSERLKPRLEAGKKYLEMWQKYEKDLAEWQKNKAEGKATQQPIGAPKEAEETAAPKVEDPITGTWTARLFGGPIRPEDEREGKIAFKLTGTAIEGRVLEPALPMDFKITGTLDGKRITGRLELETRGLGYPTFEGTIDKEDHCSGTVSLQGLTINFDMRRIDKSEVEFKVKSTRKKTTGKDGRPLPPKVDESLEPIKSILEKRIPAVVAATTSAQIDAVLDILVDQYDLPVVLLGPEGIEVHAGRLAEKNVGVVVPTDVMRRDEKNQWSVPGDVLSRRGVHVAFQSGGEDGARSLPMVGLYAVERGLSAETALAAMTIDAARMYRLDGRIGSLAPGREGDMVIFSGHPFEAGSRVERVIVGGEEVKP